MTPPSRGVTFIAGFNTRLHVWKILGALSKAHIGIEVAVRVEEVRHRGVEEILGVTPLV